MKILMCIKVEQGSLSDPETITREAAPLSLSIQYGTGSCYAATK